MAFKTYNPPILERPFTIPSRDWESLAPAWTDVWAASVRQDNSLGSLLGYGLSIAPEPRGRYNPDFNKWDVIPREFYDNADAYWWAQSPEDVDYISQRLRKQLADKRTLDRAGFSALLPSLINGTLDPINLPFMLIPAAQAARSGWGLLRSTGRVALEGGFGAGLSELALRQTQESRTGLEALMNIGGATLLSGILGGAAGSVGLGFRKLADSVEADIRTRPRQLTGQTISGGFGTGKTVQQALAEARSEGWISDGEYRLARYVFDLDSTIDENTTLEIVDAVREATDKELSGYGVDFGEGKPAILGETHTENAKTAIRLYAGHDADTVVEEFYHRFYDRLSPEEKAVFQKYYDELADPRPVNEVFAQQGRDFFFSEKLHEKAGTLKKIFEKAKSTLIALIGRIREIRGAQIPEKIQDLYRRAGEPYKEPELSVSKVEEPLKVQPEAKAEAEPVTQTQAITETVAQAEKPTVKTFIKLPENPVKQAREYVNIRLREAAQKARDAGVYDEIVQRMNDNEPLEKIAKDIKKRLNIGILDVRRMIHGIQAVERLAGGETGFQIRAPQTPEFKAWFGDSKVVDENGQPKVVYHGTAAPFFEEFSEGKDNKGFDSGLGFFFSENPKYASFFTNKDIAEFDDLLEVEPSEQGRIIPAYIKVENPFKFDSLQAVMHFMDNPGYKLNGVESGYRDAKSLSVAIEDAGYDGILIDDNFGDTWITFYSEQIKSVFNQGTFDPSDSRISYQIRNLPELQQKRSAYRDTIPALRDAFHIYARKMLDIEQKIADAERFREPDMSDLIEPNERDFATEEALDKAYEEYDRLYNAELERREEAIEKEGREEARRLKGEAERTKKAAERIMSHLDPKSIIADVDARKKPIKPFPTIPELEPLAKAAFQTHRAAYDFVKEVDRALFKYKDINIQEYKQIVNENLRPLEELTGEYQSERYDLSYQIRAYHGSPHQFSQFSTDYIGTGEGNQSFGWGLYFTSKEGIARHYAEKLTFGPDENDILINNKSVDEFLSIIKDGKKAKIIKEYIIEASPAGFLNKIMGETEFNYELFRNRISAHMDDGEEYKQILELINNSEIKTKRIYQRHLYELYLFKGKDPDDYIFIDWYEPVPDEILEKIKKQAAHEGITADFTNTSGGKLYKEISRYVSSGNIESPKEASLFLKRAGIDGIRYPAESLSGKVSDGINYVIFDAQDIEIKNLISYQIRQAVNSIADLPPGTDPNKVTRPPIIPEWAWKHVASFHPGLQPFVVKTLSTPAKMAEWLVETPERLNKNWYGERTTDAVETSIKRERNAYSFRFDDAYKGGYTRLAKRLAEEREKKGDPQGIITRLLQRYSDKKKYNQDLYEALLELSEGKRALLQMDLSKRFPPEIVETAQEIGKIYNELGKRLEAQGLLPPTYKEALEGGHVHVPRVWNQAAVMRYRGRLEQIFLEDWNERNTLPFTGGGEAPEIPDFNKTMDKIVHSPAGYLGVEIANDADPTKAGKARFLEERSIDIDSRKLWFYETDENGQVVKDRQGNPIKIHFVETDPQKIFNQYLSSTLPDIILAERNGGDITLKNFFEEINKEATEKAKQAETEAERATIFKDRDESIKNLKAMRDLLRGDFAPGGVKRDPANVWTRMSNTVRAINMMEFLGGVTISSIGDIVRPLFHWGFEYYAPALMKYATLGREGRKEFKKQMRIWGVVGDMYLHSRLNAIADVGDNTINLTTAERWVRYWQDKIGLFTGIDWWNSQVKTIAGFVANHAILDIAQQLKKAGAVDMASASRVVRRHFIEDIARMGIGLDDLLKIADEIEAAGEDFDGLILPRMDKWQDKALSARYLTALTKEVDELIVTPGVGDKPLWMHYELAKIITQFKGYPMAAMRRIVFQGMQRPDNKLAISMMFSTLMGGFVYSIKQWERGEDVTDDPKQFLYESIDRAGLFGYLLDANNYIEQLSGNRLGLNPLIGLDQTSRNRFQTSLLDVLFGPTGSTLKYGQRAALAPLDAVFGDGLTEADINAMYKLIWYSKIFGIRNVMEALRESSIETFAVNRQNEPAFTPGD